MRAKFGRDPMAGSKKVTLKFIIGSEVFFVYFIPSSRIQDQVKFLCVFRVHRKQGTTHHESSKVG